MKMMWLMLCKLAVKVAVTSLPPKDTVQVLLCFPHELTPDPDHPPKPNPAAGVAVKVTCGLPVKFAEQVPGQLMPAGVLVMVPVPAPATFTVNWETPFTSP
jgi:hypothetical protein